MPVSSPLRLHEHETLRVGERGFTQAQFDALARFNERTARKYFSIGHRLIRMRNHVGYVEVGSLAFEILPKCQGRGKRAHDAWRAGLLEMLRVATGLRIATPAAASQAVTRSRLVELVAARFIEEVERLLHEGLARAYVRREENSAAFRGRLLVPKHVRENLVRPDRFYVEHHVFGHDVVVNQVVKLALEALAGRLLSSGLQARLAACLATFPVVRDLAFTPTVFERIRLNRNTARYKDALALARMILLHHAPNLSKGGEPVFAILFDMEILWERYVTWLFRKAVPAGVSSQSSRSFWKVPGQGPRMVRPDLTVRGGDQQVVLVADAKWKRADDGIAIADLKQMFVYNELLPSDRAVLVYPSMDDTSPVSGKFVVPRGHRCETLHLRLFDDAGWSPALMRSQITQLLTS